MPPSTISSAVASRSRRSIAAARTTVTPPRSEVLSVLLQAGRGVVAAHAAGLVPRDLEPDNIMVGDDGRPAVSWSPTLR